MAKLIKKKTGNRQVRKPMTASNTRNQIKPSKKLRHATASASNTSKTKNQNRNNQSNNAAAAAISRSKPRSRTRSSNRGAAVSATEPEAVANQGPSKEPTATCTTAAQTHPARLKSQIQTQILTILS